MPMPGADFRVVREQILDAYSEDDLRTTLRELMNVRLDNEVAPGPMRTRVFNLLEWAEQRGREAELIRATALARPHHKGMQEIYHTYGMAVPVTVVQSGGAAQLESVEPAVTVDAGQAGFERTVRSHIPFADISLWREQITAVEARVCQITFRGAAQGTGFLVGPDAVLTNYHVLEQVINGVIQPTDVECVFDFKKLADGSTMRTPVALHPTDWNIDSSRYTDEEKSGRPDQTAPTVDELDYALVRLAEQVGAKPWAANPGGGAPNRGWIRVPEVQPEFSSPMGIIIAQHPNGWPMKLGIDTNAIDRNARPPLWLNGSGTRVRYATNTEGGSSGSPVFDLNWKLVALHHYGDPNWGDPAAWNQGIPIGLIRERLKRTGKANLLGSHV